MDKPLRLIGQRTVVYPAWRIPELGFGSVEFTRRLGDGAVATEHIPRAFTLCCACHVSRWDECGGVCLGCREALEQEVLIGPFPQIGNDQIEWMATACKLHFRLCSYPFCSVGGCPRHLAVASDGKLYCLTHHREVEAAATTKAIGMRFGYLAARCQSIFASLFLDK